MKPKENEKHLQVMMEMYENASQDDINEAGYETNIVYFKATADPFGFGLDHLNELSKYRYLDLFCRNTLFPLLDQLIDIKNTIPKEASQYYEIYLKQLREKNSVVEQYVISNDNNY